MSKRAHTWVILGHMCCNLFPGCTFGLLQLQVQGPLKKDTKQTTGLLPLHAAAAVL